MSEQWVSQLKARLAVVEAERDHILELLKMHRGEQTDLLLNAQERQAPSREVVQKGHVDIGSQHRGGFAADPNSRTSRILDNSRSIVERMSGQAEMRDVMRRLPPEFTRTAKDKAYVRTALHRGGKRVGLEFVGPGLLVARNKPQAHTGGL